LENKGKQLSYIQGRITHPSKTHYKHESKRNTHSYPINLPPNQIGTIEFPINKQKTVTTMSLMPPNMTDLLVGNEMNDLVAWLLTLRVANEK